MEHRYATRVPRRINTLIYRQGLPVQVGRTRDISREGAFLETGQLQGPLPDCLELEFLPGMESVERFRLKAIVVHRHTAGIGIEFAWLDPRAEQGLRECLRHSPPPVEQMPQPEAIGYG
ncbi:MAG: PilZ domain-containing protein [Gammaproteobacteria bacterium]|nr:PilZ domain-containing protein [Gammaproteobacteria bacterium]